MPEWLKGADCKSAALCYVGSNPTRPNYIILIFYILTDINWIHLVLNLFI
jgi:hypothetical protein